MPCTRMATAQELRSALKQEGMRMTPQRQLILEAVAAMQGHISVDHVYRQVSERFPDVNITTVYRTLEVLEELGFVRHTHFHDSSYQFQRTDEPAHQHLVCTACGRDQELDLSVRYWEGAVRAEGTGPSGALSGQGYLELAGY